MSFALFDSSYYLKLMAVSKCTGHDVRWVELKNERNNKRAYFYSPNDPICISSSFES